MSEQAAARGALDRETLAGLADVLIPAADGMPSASEAGATQSLLDEVLQVRGDLEEPLRAIAAAARGKDPAAEVALLEAESPELFEALTTAVAGGYFLSPDVRRRLGYPGQQAKKLEDDFDQELLQPVIDRGPIFRPTPAPDRSGA
jgi:DNA-binding NarL/FixJ family response regulator